MNVRKGVNAAHLFARRRDTGDSNKKSEKYATFSTADLGLNQQHYMGSLPSCLVLCAQHAAQSAGVGRWNSETSRFCEGVRIILARTSVVVDVTWFSDEAYFQLDCHNNPLKSQILFSE
jgi:hypothetical protein